MATETVAVLGASPKEDRPSNQAVKDLLAHGHRAIPVHPTATSIHGQACVASLTALPTAVDTISLYVGAERSTALQGEILAAKPRRLIFNPGAENPALAQAARAAGIAVQEACTLVLLRTGQF